MVIQKVKYSKYNYIHFSSQEFLQTIIKFGPTISFYYISDFCKFQIFIMFLFSNLHLFIMLDIRYLYWVCKCIVRLTAWLHIKIPPTGYIVSYNAVLLWLLQDGGPLKVLRMCVAPVHSWEVQSIVRWKVLPTCRSHSGNALHVYETYAASRG